jgi:hypothetical protein
VEPFVGLTFIAAVGLLSFGPFSQPSHARNTATYIIRTASSTPIETLSTLPSDLPPIEKLSITALCRNALFFSTQRIQVLALLAGLPVGAFFAERQASLANSVFEKGCSCTVIA